MIALACVYTEPFTELSRLTGDENKLLYCDRHDFSWNNKFIASYDKIGFEKIRLVKDILPFNEWVWCTGTDSLITNFTNNLSELTNTDASFIITSDRNGINADSFLIKNDAVGRFIIDWSLENEHWLASEQEGFARLFGQLEPTMLGWRHVEGGLAPTIKMVPQRAMNSYNYNLYPNPEESFDKLGTDGNWQEGDLLIHWPGFADNPELRVGWAREYMQRIKYA